MSNPSYKPCQDPKFRKFIRDTKEWFLEYIRPWTPTMLKWMCISGFALGVGFSAAIIMASAEPPVMQHLRLVTLGAWSVMATSLLIKLFAHSKVENNE